MSELPREVLIDDWTFDDSLKAMLTLFVASSGEGWPGIMFSAIDAVGPNQQPMRDHSIAAALYFVALVLLVQFFLLQLIVTVIFDNFRQLKQRSEGFGAVTHRQRLWIRAQRMMARARPHEIHPVNRT